MDGTWNSDNISQAHGNFGLDVRDISAATV